MSEQVNLLTGEVEPPVNTQAPGYSRNTPESVLQIVREYAPIGLDPCSNEYSTVNARVEWTEADDGLTKPWADTLRPGEIAWVNPPWNDIMPWARKAANEWRAESLVWTQHDHSTAWARHMMDHCELVALWKKRVNHPIGGVTNSGSPWCNALWYFGFNADRVGEFFSKHAYIMERRHA